MNDLLFETTYTDKIIKKDTTIVPFGTEVIFAPGEVKPGHIMFAPLKTNLIAPLSTCCQGKKNGSARTKSM